MVPPSSVAAPITASPLDQLGEPRVSPLLARLVRQGWSYKWLVLAMLASTGLVTLLTGTQIALVKDLLDALSKTQHDPSGRDAAIAEIQRVALILLGLAPLMAACAYGAWLCGQYLANRCMRDLRTRFVSHLVRQELAFHGDLARGELIARVTTDLDRLYSAQALLFGKFIQHPAMAVGYVGFVFYTSWQVGLLVLVGMIPMIVSLNRILSKTRRRSQRAQESLATSLVAFEQITAGIRVIKTMGSTEREVARYDGLNGDLFATRQRLARARAQSESVTQGSVLLIAGVAMLGAAWLFAKDAIQPIALIACLGAVGLLIGKMRDLQKVWADIIEHLPACARVFAVLDRPSTLTDRPNAAPMTAPQRDIRLNQVSFRYQANADLVLDRIDLTIPVGKVTALVGPSGGGKSTLLDLIPRLRDVTSGNITWDGIDIRDVTSDSLIHQVAIVSQESFLFNDTIRNNIAYGKPDANDADIIAAATRAHVHDAILTLEGGAGYDTVVGDRGGRLSGGQRQRIAIARALLRNAPILLLDEPTSALDATSEAHVQAALDELMRNRTTVVIAHRLATVQHAHRIHVIGKHADHQPSTILESGTHADLVAKNGVYAGLVKLQQLQ